ncbi:STAS domain-containing protein [Palleronia pelagia]|uniref:Anti-sigma factor antagonist n=1 Tax=Palleronia pelagia TaxID=387096 RepID=A0A1H8D9E8_9RHOB|nr:STAS domain-containing protein [Palleronia pelagia]SEN03882.1 anti-sigma B factor antagonist [Palleronia pelagia]
MIIDTHQTEDATVLRVRERRLDAAVAVQFKDAVRAASAGARGRVVLDLARVDFMDSSGLGAVIGVHKMMPPHQVLELAGLRDAVAQVFRLTRMDTLFTIHARAPGAEEPAADPAQAIHHHAV